LRSSMRICSRSAWAEEYSCWAAEEGGGRAVVVSSSPGPGAGGVVAGGVAGGTASGPSGDAGATGLPVCAAPAGWTRAAGVRPRAASDTEAAAAVEAEAAA